MILFTAGVGGQQSIFNGMKWWRKQSARGQGQTGVSRRNFLRGAGLFGLGSAAATLTPSGTVTAATGAKPAAAAPAYDLDRLRKVDPALVRYEELPPIALPQKDPSCLAVSAGGSLLVGAGRRLLVLDAQGELQREIRLADEVRCVASAADGRIFVGLRDHVELLGAEGKSQARWAAPAAKAWLTALAVNDQWVFAADAGNRVVWKFNHAGKVVGKLGAKDASRNVPGFVIPSPSFDLELAPDAVLWVTNPGRHQVEAYTLDGDFISGWGDPSFAIGGFCGCCNPAFFTRLPDGRFVTSEKGLPRIKIYSPAGKFESVVAPPDSFPKYFELVNASPMALDIVADARGRILVADTLAGCLRVFRPKNGGAS